MQKKRVKTIFRPLPPQDTGPVVFSSSKFESSSSTNGFHKTPQHPLPLQIPQRSRTPIVPDPEKAKPKLSTCVTFQKETDGRFNFPNQRDFQDFCKQRDLFYGVKEIWTLKHSDQAPPVPAGYGGPTQNYDPAFGKMRALFNLNSTATNLSRLSALFLSQCVLDSAYSSNQVGPSIAENNVRKILQSNPSKLEQLKQRVAPPEATVDFIQISDPMGFLKYFVSSANVPSSFTQYLMDRAVFEITEVEHSADQDFSDEKDILDLMKKSRLLAKMLGYLYFAPYRPDKITRGSTEADLHNQASLRSYQAPPLDLFTILQKAFAQNRLVFTLPWILEFLSQADPATFFLSAYKPALNLISSIYQEILLSNLTNYSIGIENRTFLRLYFDTLFEPDGGGGGVECFFKKKQEVRLFELVSEDVVRKIHESEEPIDRKDSIGATLNPVCFNKQKKKIEILPDMLICPPSPFPDRVTVSEDYNSIQTELETQFFQIYPPSMKKTVDFISERVASNFVKRLRNQILLDLRKSFKDKLVFGEEAVALCKLEIKKQQNEFCLQTCREAVGLLVESGIEQVQTYCSQICQRKAEEKITEWVLKHVTKELFPVSAPPSDELADAETKPEPVKPATIASSPAPSVPFELLKMFHSCSQALHNGQSITTAEIHTILDEHGQGLLSQKPWIPNSTVTLAIELATFQPLLLKETLPKFIKFWSTWNESESEGEFKVLCLRNLVLLAKSKNEKETWNVMDCMLKSLVKSGLVESKNLVEQCVTLLRVDWPKNVSHNISLLLKNLVESLKDRSSRTSVDTEMIDWIASYCSGQDV